MESYDILILTRSLERIIAALLGGGAIYLAYAVFTRLPDLSQMKDNFKFRKYIQLHFVKIVAGIFFLIFGGYIVLATVLKTVHLKQIGPDELFTIYSGVNEKQQAPPISMEFIDTAAIPKHFRMLENVPNNLKDELDGTIHHATIQAVTQTRLNLMMAIWDDDRWGDKKAFREWVNKGEPSHPSSNIKAAAIKFYHGS